MGPEANRQSIDAPFPSEDLQKYKEQGKTIVYVSFGTVATNPHFWNYNPSPTKMFGAKSSGKVFCQAMWQRIFEAFGKNDKYVVVMATVAEDPDALKGFEIPANFIVRRRCPQLDVLKVADVFHHPRGSQQHDGVHQRPRANARLAVVFRSTR